MIRQILLALLATSAIASAARAPREQLPTAALLSFKEVPAGEEGLRTLLDRIFQEAFRSGSWRLVERQRVDALVSERAFQEAGACSTSCAATIGGLLGVRDLLLPEFDRVDGVSTISLRELDVASGEVLRVAYVETSDPVGPNSRRIAKLLVGRLLGDSTVPESDSGWIAVTSDPPSEIWIDGVSVGTSPLVVPAWPGIHRIATIPDQTIPAPAKAAPAAPDVAATTIVIVDGDRGPRHRGPPPRRVHPGPGQGPDRFRDGPRSESGGSDRHDPSAAVAVGAVAAVAGVALVAAAASMPDSVWSESWKDAKVAVADTARVTFRKEENGGKGALGIIGLAALVFGVLIAVVALR